MAQCNCSSVSRISRCRQHTEPQTTLHHLLHLQFICSTRTGNRTLHLTWRVLHYFDTQLVCQCEHQAACLPNGSPIPSAWTCDTAKYGDCNCDCNCGASDRDCAAGACATCTHDVCATGAALGRSCTTDGQNGACIQAICDADPYCCTTTWGASCVDKVKQGLYGCTPRTCR